VRGAELARRQDKLAIQNSSVPHRDRELPHSGQTGGNLREIPGDTPPLLAQRASGWLDAGMTEPDHGTDPHSAGHASRLNWLRAGVLGANDGIVSVAALVVGVAAATPDAAAILIAGVAALLAGAISMALGEYVSVSSQRDTERALIAKERWELEHMPEQELAELAGLYRAKGLTAETAKQVALELTAHDALGAHLEVELHIGTEELSNPWHAAYASALAFTVGAILPLLAVLLPPQEWRLPATFLSVAVALIITGWLSAYLGGSPRTRAISRVLVGGLLALAVTWAIGALIGTSI
jgi:VIT1/CCC1 family predicted Fe2+/Mn2+ transporter